MQRIILTAVGIIYLILGLWCTVSPRETAEALGFMLSDSGLVEFVVVYGGLEVGLGLAMIVGARRTLLLPGVLFMTTVFSACLPLFRAGMLLLYPASPAVLAILALEVTILVALLLARRSAP